jgi:rubredoxin
LTASAGEPGRPGRGLHLMTAFVPGCAGGAIPVGTGRRPAVAAAAAADSAWLGCPVRRCVASPFAWAPLGRDGRWSAGPAGRSANHGGRAQASLGGQSGEGQSAGSAAVPMQPRVRGERSPRAARVIGVVGKISFSRDVTVTQEVVPLPAEGRGLFGVKAKAYWESMGVLPLSFAAFGIAALIIKLAKVKKGQWKAGEGGINRATTHASIVTTEEEEAELHVFKCGGCGYEIYPARGREFKFFPDSFKCPLCATPKAEFWDLNDPTDPRNQESDEEDYGDEDDDGAGAGGPGPNPGAGVAAVVEAADTSPNA